MKAAQDIVLKPVITEKSMDLLPDGKYTFKVAKDANKLEIKQAVETLFGVEVLKVNTVNCRGRQKRVGRFVGSTASWKKAIVTVNPNPTAGKDGKKRKGTIEFFEGMY
ncbi:MAG: 50S ribosomal protein L23 [Ruminococcus sp.]|nr:50S ribosomal protein L23 [Ruminococcus sp.]MBQ8906373.1 50S ribosomal protein L23 [Ruminococcus sp.]